MQLLRPKTAAQSQAETTHMARRLFVSPPPRRMILPIAVFSAMEGFLLFFPSLDLGRFLAAAFAIAPAKLRILSTLSTA
ncbi:MAG: hypothetical protein HYW06_11670 [Gemmatimonadetes bacterium]|nr:hypothetical protein [Gemmatimonadota bacterium]